jgi:hypothetical protein
MARESQYPDQLVVLVSEERGSGIRELDELTGLGISEITRQCIEEGWPAVSKRLKAKQARANRSSSRT